MSDALFPGNGNYLARLEGWRNGRRVYGRMTVHKLAGTGHWTLNPQAYGAAIAGASADGSWTYDFRGTSAILVYEWYRDLGPGTHSVDGWVEMAGFGRAWPGSVLVTVPPDAPAAPDSLTIARVGDTRHTVSWYRRATSTAPYSSQQVQRRMYNNGAWTGWTGVANINSGYSNNGLHSWADTGTVGNRIYQYRIKASNASGEALSAGSQNVYTTPGTPTNVKAAKQASGAIDVSWTRGSTAPNIVTSVDFSTNNQQSWTALSSGLAAGTVKVTHSTPPSGQEIIYRVRHTISDSGKQGHGLTSAYGVSNKVPLTAPPLAPSKLAPNGVAFDGALPQVFTWQHNSADSSTQTAFEIQYRQGTGSWSTTGKVASNAATRTFAADTFTNGNSYEYQVRTWGAHANPSPWSASATFAASSPPVASITFPESEVPLDSAMLTAAWDYNDPDGTGQSSWEAKLLQQGTEIESRSGSGGASSVSFTSRLEDQTEYQVQVRVRDGSLMWSDWDTVTFDTSFPSPPVPLIDASWDTEQGMVVVTVNNPDGTPAVVRNEILRSTDDGATWTMVGTAPVDGLGFDPTVDLGIAVQYKALAWSSLPSSSESSVVELSTDGIVGYWSGGEAFNTSLRIQFNYKNPPRLNLKTKTAVKVLNYYAGRTRPVETQGVATSRAGTLEFMVNSVEALHQARSMILLPAPHLIRLPDGTTLYASVGELSENRRDEGWYQLSIPVTEVDA